MRRRSVRDHRRPRRRRRLLALGVAALLLIGLGAALVVDALVVRASLADAELAVDDARQVLATGDVAGARDRLVGARSDLERATLRTNRFLWRAAERVPIGGASFATLGQLVRVVDQGTGAGAAVVGVLEPLLGPAGQLRVQPTDGQLPVELLDAVSGAAAALDPSGLEQALAGVRAVQGPVPGVIATGRDRVLATGDQAVRTLEIAAPIAEVLPEFLGLDGRQRYLLGMQNPAELRGTGGLIGFTAELTVEDGRMAISRPQSYSALDALGRAGDGSLRPVETTEAFAARYAAQNAAGFLGNVNVDPDLPTSGTVLLDLVEERTGRQFDGLLLVDPLAVAHVLAQIGPVQIDPEVAATAPDLPTTVDPDRFADLVMVEHYAAFEGRNRERREWLSEVASAAFTRIFDAEWDGASVTTAVLEVAGSGHLAVNLRDADRQAAFAAADLTGALQPPGDQDADLLAVTANNSAGNKLDRHVQHRLAASIELSGDPSSGVVERSSAITVTVANPVEPGDHSLYVEGSFPVSRGTRTPPAAERGLTRTWWSVWAPALDRVALAGAGEDASPSWVIHDHRVVDEVLEVPSAAAASFDATIRGDVRVEPVGGGATYRLHLRRQPKAIVDRLDLTVRAPEGWRIAGGDASGGDAAIGVVGSGLHLTIVDGVATLEGAITSSAVLELRLERG